MSEKKDTTPHVLPRIGILFGGASPEYPVSLQSAYAVLSHLDRTRYQPVLLGISRDGQWFLYEGPLSHIPDDTWRQDAFCTPAWISPDRTVRGVTVWDGQTLREIALDAAFPLLHGKNGEDGTVQGVLELAGIPLIGCGTLSSALCMDKLLAHQAASALGIPVPRDILAGAHWSKEQAEQAAADLSYPLFVKPVRAGSSFGITQVKTPEELMPALREAFHFDTRVILEETVPGFEVGCAVLGKGELFTGAVDEIELSQGFFDYSEKYTLRRSKIHVPARIAPETARQVQETAKKLYQGLGCSGFARVDFFLTPQGKLLFNEINTIPGFTAHSRYPGMMRAAGLPFEELIDRLIQTEVRP